ncbi:MAG: TIM barrel protein [Oscillospiraceae bacterium]|nr:TIM barrel protein [Oscillospiraceae bacterium]
MNAFFGPAGRDDSLNSLGYKTTLDIPRCMQEKGLDAFEYQCGRGVNVKTDVAKQLGSLAKEKNIRLSLHAPYYISLSSVEAEKRDKSIDYIMQSAKATDAMGANRIIVHSGSCSKITREYALELAKDTLLRARKALDESGLGHIHICPETMGKINQLGTLSEVMELCKIDDRMIPCIDFGHLNARDLGIIKGEQEYAAILDEIENKLGADRLKIFHSHFSKIEYTAGGEKQHLTFDDTQFGPDFEPLMNQVVKRNLAPTFICESAGTQSDDALKMKQYYLKLKSGE